MTDAGFSGATFRRMTGGICAIHVGHKAQGTEQRAQNETPRAS